MTTLKLCHAAAGFEAMVPQIIAYNKAGRCRAAGNGFINAFARGGGWERKHTNLVPQDMSYSGEITDSYWHLFVKAIGVANGHT